MSKPVLGVDVPDRQECYGNHRTPSAIALYGDVWACPQCDGRHAHVWVRVWVPEHRDHAWRCRECGGRRCDVDCMERRHHQGPHMAPDGSLRPVGK